MSEAQLTRIRGIGPATARTLIESGFASVAAIAQASTEDVQAVQGFGAIRAAALIDAARELTGDAKSSKPAPKPAETEKKKKKKDKGKSKSKGSRKKKKKKKDKSKKKKDGKKSKK